VFQHRVPEYFAPGKDFSMRIEIGQKKVGAGPRPGQHDEFLEILMPENYQQPVGKILGSLGQKIPALSQHAFLPLFQQLDKVFKR
jgi:hypothetical protein